MKLKQISLVDISGEKVDSIVPPEEVMTPSKFNRHVIFESVNIENQNRRQGTHDTKNKSEVSGTGKKPYRQKHTGRARQGSRRNPHYRGGGIAFGPTPQKNYKIRVNRKIFKIALISVWFKIAESEKVLVLDDSFSSINFKTQDFVKFLKNSKLDKSKILLITTFDEKQLSISARNIERLTIKTPDNCSIRDLLNQEQLLITKAALDLVFKKLSTWK